MPQIKCPNGHRLQVPDRAIGQTISCPTCQASFIVEGTAEPSALELGSDERRPALSGGKGMPGGFTIVSAINCFVGRPLLFLGLILVVLGRGCDATSMRSVGRTSAQYNQEREKFRLEWDAKAADVRQELAKKNREINEMFDGEKGKGGPGPGDQDFQNKLSALQKQQGELNKKLNRMRDDQNSAEAEKEAKEWKPLRAAYMQGHTNHQMSVYWYQWIFIFGTVVLVLGILTLAFTGQGAEKWIAYIMIAILMFSIYVVGAAWFESVASSFDRSGPPIFRDREIIKERF